MFSIKYLSAAIALQLGMELPPECSCLVIITSVGLVTS